MQYITTGTQWKDEFSCHKKIEKQSTVLVRNSKTVPVCSALNY